MCSFKFKSRCLDRRRLSEAWFTWKLRTNLKAMKNHLKINSTVLHFNSKTTESVLNSEILNIKSFLVRKGLLEHQTCLDCDSNCNSIRKKSFHLYCKFNYFIIFLNKFYLMEIGNKSDQGVYFLEVNVIKPHA